MDGRKSASFRGLSALKATMADKINIKLSKQLCERARSTIRKAGYSSLEEFIEHAVERDLQKLEQSDSKEELIQKMKGLGYLE